MRILGLKLILRTFTFFGSLVFLTLCGIGLSPSVSAADGKDEALWFVMLVKESNEKLILYKRRHNIERCFDLATTIPKVSQSSTFN